MRRTMIKLVASFAVALFVLPVLAGDGHKCEASAQECVNKMAEKFQNKGWLGVELDRSETGQLSIVKIIPDSPAHKAGLMAGEALVALNGIDYNEANKEQLKKAYQEFIPGKEVTYTLASAKGDREVTVTLGVLPDDVKAKWMGAHMLEYHTSVAVN